MGRIFRVKNAGVSISRDPRIAKPSWGTPGGLYLQAGRTLTPGRRREALVSEAFANAHGLNPGATVDAVMNGRWEQITVVGIAFSPEYIYQIREGELLPDARRFGIFWMDEDELSAAFDVEGAFNDLAVQLAPGANELEVIRRIDDLTEPYGSLGAYGRVDHVVAPITRCRPCKRPTAPQPTRPTASPTASSST